MNRKNDRIIRRVKRLLALAEDKANVHESQLALVNAQEMMVKYGIDPNELDTSKELKEVLTKSATDYKRLWWWERSLATVVSDNFRCTWYYNSKKLEGRKQVSRRIIFVGYEEDVELATEMYSLVIEVVKFYSSRFIKREGIQGDRGKTLEAKDDYISGFISGLEKKFEEQISDNEWGLVIVTPKAVNEKLDDITKDGETINWTIPDLASIENYETGFKEGYTVDYTKSTIGNEK